MRVKCGVNRTNDRLLGDKYGVSIEFEGLWARAGGLGYCHGRVETYGLELVSVRQLLVSVHDTGGLLTTTAKQRGRCGNVAL